MRPMARASTPITHQGTGGGSGVLIECPRDSGVVGINGAAAHLIHPGDLVILIAYGMLDEAEAKVFEPRVVFVDSDNHITRIGTDPAEALPDGTTVRGDELHAEDRA